MSAAKHTPIDAYSFACGRSEGYCRGLEYASAINTDLLAALEAMIDDADVCEVAGIDAVNSALAAIAKARGQS